MPETLIIAPQFFEQSAIPGDISDGMLFWRASPFRGSSRGGIGPDVSKVDISAFDVIDDWLATLTDPQLFPELTDKRNVFYLCGSKDNNPNDASIGTSYGAMMQGRHRLERMQVFAAFLESKSGKSINKAHRFFVVRGMGHYGKGTMASQQGLMALFSPIR